MARRWPVRAPKAPQITRICGKPLSCASTGFGGVMYSPTTIRPALSHRKYLSGPVADALRKRRALGWGAGVYEQNLLPFFYVIATCHCQVGVGHLYLALTCSWPPDLRNNVRRPLSSTAMVHGSTQMFQCLQQGEFGALPEALGGEMAIYHCGPERTRPAATMAFSPSYH